MNPAETGFPVADRACAVDPASPLPRDRRLVGGPRPVQRRDPPVPRSRHGHDRAPVGARRARRDGHRPRVGAPCRRARRPGLRVPAGHRDRRGLRDRAAAAAAGRGAGADPGELRRPVPGDVPRARQRAGGRRLVDAGAAVRRAPGARQPVVRGRGDRRRRPLRPGGLCGRSRRRAGLVGHPVGVAGARPGPDPRSRGPGGGRRPRGDAAGGRFGSISRAFALQPRLWPCSGSWPWPTPASSGPRSSWRSGSSSWAGSPPTSP